jgi:hypothetical protein
VFVLKTKRDTIVKDNIEWKPTEMQSRGISLSKHEKCEFPFEQVYEDKQLNMLGMGKAKKKKDKNDQDSSESDEYDIDEGDDMDYNIVEREEVNPLEDQARRDRNVNEGTSKDRSNNEDEDYDNNRRRGNTSNSR